MFGKSRKAQQAIEPGKEAESKKSRFQIVKLEERIAPNRPHCYYSGPGKHHRYGCHHHH
jgi:hypothetical protein